MQGNKEKYCPNMFFDSDNVSIGEFKTIEEAMEYPLKGCWCVNREENNLFDKFEQNQKALFSILVTLYGIVRDAKLLQSSNAPFSMLVTLLGMVTDCML